MILMTKKILQARLKMKESYVMVMFAYKNV